MSDTAIACCFPGLLFNPEKARQFIDEKRYDLFCSEVEALFAYFQKLQVVSFDPEQLAFLGQAADAVLYGLSKDDLVFSSDDGGSLYWIYNNMTLARMTFFSQHRDAHKLLQAILHDPRHLVKVFILYTPFCPGHLDEGLLFKADPYLATIWWSSIFASSVHLPEATFTKRLQRIYIAGLESDLFTFDDPQKRFHQSHFYELFPYFSCSYTFPNLEHRYKQKLHYLIRKSNAFIKLPPPCLSNRLQTQDTKKHIVIISRDFHIRHAVFRSIYPMIQSLADDYHLHLYNLREIVFEEDKPLYKKLFKTVTCILNEKNQFISEAIEAQQKAYPKDVAIYPDIGLTPQAVVLANRRLASIQLTTYAHPTSTFGADIDYFIGGQEVETTQAQANYSERLVLIPGLAVTPVMQHLNTDNEAPTTKLKQRIILCPWGSRNIHPEHLHTLKIIQAQTSTPFKYFFIGLLSSGAHGHIASTFLKQYFGSDHFMFSMYQHNNTYINFLLQGDFGIDSFPFGGFNRVIDLLLCKKPFVALEGGRAYNRLAAALLRNIGLEELIATSKGAYCEKILRLIDDTSYLKAITQHVTSIDLQAELKKLYEHTPYFKKAIDYLIEHHHDIQQSSDTHPIFIQ